MAKSLKKAPKKPKASFGKRLGREFNRNWILYLMILPVIVYFLIFCYGPMYGIIIAFKKYNAKLGILGSEWVGFKHFIRFFKAHNFKSLLGNTLGISFYNILITFPLPIIFALLLHYLDIKPLKKFIQMISYAPHFLSTVVICSLLTLFCAKEGFLNIILGFFGIESSNLLGKPNLFKHIYVWSAAWQQVGWSAIIYMAALSGVDQQMHEAAIVDGASKLQRMCELIFPRSFLPSSCC